MFPDGLERDLKFKLNINQKHTHKTNQIIRTEPLPFLAPPLLNEKHAMPVLKKKEALSCTA
jgi:hypothetical protein